MLFGLCAGFSVASAWAVEGAVAAGPIGGSDIRSAILPPPGLYGGAVALYNNVTGYNDGTGHPAPALNAVGINNYAGGAFFLYVPDVKLFDGRIGLAGFESAEKGCGQLVSVIPKRCITGFGDPYFELSWSRSFGALRPPTTAGAFPIVQGLVVDAGIGAVLPIGNYNQQTQAQNAVSAGNSTLDIAPSVAVTYTTPPLIADGTEFSAKLYWDNYATNPVTQYHASSLFDVDFAVTEHIGRFQLGPAGFYIFQTGEDRQYGAIIPPDGRRLEYMAMGGVINYDMAEYNAVIRFKANTTVVAQNGVVAKLFVLSFAKKFF
jgi:Putative MetA-pathway of phenol degradation